MNQAQDPVVKPAQVARATTLLWFSLAIGAVIALLDLYFLQSLASAGFTVFVMAFVLAIIALLIHKISAGRNWARITFLVFFVLGTTSYVPNLIAMFSRSAITGSLSLLQVVLQMGALYLIFTNPGAGWFKSKAVQ